MHVLSCVACLWLLSLFDGFSGRESVCSFAESVSQGCRGPPVSPCELWCPVEWLQPPQPQFERAAAALLARFIRHGPVACNFCMHTLSSKQHASTVVWQARHGVPLPTLRPRTRWGFELMSNMVQQFLTSPFHCVFLYLTGLV
jgi:hypothetical protein